MADEVRQKFEAQSEVPSETPDAFEQAWKKYNPRGNAGGWEKVAFTSGFGAGFAAGKRAGEIARWIPVTEKLPQFGVQVMVLTTPGRYVHVVLLDESAEWRDYNFDRTRPENYSWMALNEVTHWQPLPAAPEQEKP